jgi:hypothetical protein
VSPRDGIEPDVATRDALAATAADEPLEEPSLDWLRVERGRVRPRLLATIHATVDLDRALVDAHRLDRTTVASPPRDDPSLGARVVVLSGRHASGAGTPPAIVVAEPIREGRLAGWLARWGEGVAGWYIEIDLDVEVAARLAAAEGLGSGQIGSGPFGRSVLVATRRRPAPPDRLLILVQAASVPSRP